MRGLGRLNRQLIKLYRCRAVFPRALTPTSAMQSCSSYSSSASHVSLPSTSENHTDFEAIRTEMLARPPQIHTDIMDPTNSRLLTKALSEFLPEECLPRHEMPQSVASPSFCRSTHLPPGHHLVYFPLALRSSELCPDGTDPYHSPRRTPLTRRMWAGGLIQGFSGLKLDGSAAACVERIADVQVHGAVGSEKIFVVVHREYLTMDPSGPKFDYGKRRRGFLENPSQHGRVETVERRTLVFMREPSDEEKKLNVEKEQKIVRAPKTPTHSITLTPTPTLLFHYSALSYNAHRIHFDRSYCHEVEGYRDLLVHGPLSLTLMLSVLQSQLTQSENHYSFIDSIDYRHLAPLYVNQPMRVCCAPRAGQVGTENGDGVETYRWDLWVENQDGGLCVKGAAVTLRYPKHLRSREQETKPGYF